MDRLHLFFAVNYFAQGMSGVAYEPISYLLKDRLKLSAGESASFVAWMTFPFLLKPIFGALTDMLAVGGFRRKPHIMIVSSLAAAAWLVLGARDHYGYWAMLGLLILVNVGVAASDVICDAVMVERGKESRKTGLYQAVQIATLYAALVVTGLGGGWLTAHAPPRLVFAACALFPAMIFFSSLWLREPRVLAPARRSLQGLSRLLGERRFWLLSLFIFLWSFTPFLGTAQFYYQSNVLGLSPVFIGFLSTLSGVAGLLGAGFYGRAVGRIWGSEALVKAAVVIGCPLSLLYAFSLGPVSVTAVTLVLGVAGVAFRLALMDLAAQSCPGYAEGTAFAAYMTVFNLAAWASNTAGGWLYDALGGRMTPYGAIVVLTLIGSLCTGACWWLLPSLAKQGA